MIKLTVVGNLSKDPETRTVNTARGATSVTNFYICANGRDKNKKTYFRATAWGKAGETIARYASKGSKMTIIGEVDQSVYINRNGDAAGTLEITVDDFEFESAAKVNRSFEAVADSAPEETYMPFKVDPETAEIIEEDDESNDDLPF